MRVAGCGGAGAAAEGSLAAHPRALGPASGGHLCSSPRACIVRALCERRGGTALLVHQQLSHYLHSL